MKISMDHLKFAQAYPITIANIQTVFPFFYYYLKSTVLFFNFRNKGEIDESS